MISARPTAASAAATAIENRTNINPVAAHLPRPRFRFVVVQNFTLIAYKAPVWAPGKSFFVMIAWENEAAKSSGCMLSCVLTYVTQTTNAFFQE